MKQIFTLIFSALALQANAQIPSYVPSDSLKCLYMFDDSINYAKDYSFNHNDLSSTSAVARDTDRNGLADGAFRLINTGQIVSSFKGVPDRNSRTMSCWVCVEDFSFDKVEQDFPYYNRRHIFGYSDFRVYLTGNMVEFATATDSRVIAALPNMAGYYKLTPNTWHMITVTFDGSIGNDAHGVNFYIDGAALNNSEVSPYNGNRFIGSANDDFIVGMITNDTAQNFRGKVDEIGFWSKALTAGEISTLYTGNVTHVPIVKTSNFSISPNPAHNILNIESSASIGDVEIIDFTGKRVLSQSVSENKCSIDISNLPKGTYILKANGLYVDKLIKN